LPTKPPPIAPTTVATVWPVPPPIRLPNPPPTSAPPIAPTAFGTFWTASCWIESTVPTRDAGCSTTWYAGCVLQPAIASSAPRGQCGRETSPESYIACIVLLP
jgi:hypothetical protein